MIAAGVVLLGLWGVGASMPAALPRACLWVAGWVALWGVLAASGLTGRFDLRPPPMALMFVLILAGGALLGRSRVGSALAHGVPLWALVAFHGFRLPLELLMHRAADEGVMPEVMSYSGYNFDIVTGATALLVAFAVKRGHAGRRTVLLWNVLGSCLLAAIAVIAVLATPMVQAFGPDQLNVWVTRFPFIYLPAILVLAALAGHVVVFRRLAADRSEDRSHAAERRRSAARRSALPE